MSVALKVQVVMFS